MEKISFEDFVNSEVRRREQMKVKSEAVWVTFLELDGIINVAKFAREYFKKTPSWLAQRIKGYNVNGRSSSFTSEEYKLLTASLRSLAQRINDYADAIDNAEE